MELQFRGEMKGRRSRRIQRGVYGIGCVGVRGLARLYG